MKQNQEQNQADPRYLLANIAKILKRLKIPYIITGGMAVLLWGRPRFTADIDIVIELKEKHIDKLEVALRELGEAGYIDKDMIVEALKNNGEFNFIDGDSGVKVDFWVMENSVFDLSRMKRGVFEKIFGEMVCFSSPEDLILIKLLWAKKSPSTRQIEDVQSILKISGKKIDKNYLKLWAGKLGIFEYLNGMIDENKIQ